MKEKILLIGMFCFVILVSCSAEDVSNFNSGPINTAKPDTINTGNESDTIGKPEDGKESTIIRNVVVAHRGAWKKNNFPANSIASLKEAIKLGCKGSEFDVVLTADDSLVICHDAKYNNRIIQDSKYSDLITLRLSNGERLPTLREYISAGKQNNTKTLLFCEFKNYGLSAARRQFMILKVLELASKLEAQKLMVYASFEYNLLKQIEILNPLASTLYLSGDTSPELLKLDKIKGACYNYPIFKSHLDWIGNAKTIGISIGAWTVNDNENINWFLKNDFDYIVTDEPELALNNQK